MNCPIGEGGWVQRQSHLLGGRVSPLSGHLRFYWWGFGLASSFLVRTSDKPNCVHLWRVYTWGLTPTQHPIQKFGLWCLSTYTKWLQTSISYSNNWNQETTKSLYNDHFLWRGWLLGKSSLTHTMNQAQMSMIIKVILQ